MDILRAYLFCNVNLAVNIAFNVIIEILYPTGRDGMFSKMTGARFPLRTEEALLSLSFLWERSDFRVIKACMPARADAPGLFHTSVSAEERERERERENLVYSISTTQLTSPDDWRDEKLRCEKRSWALRLLDNVTDLINTARMRVSKIPLLRSLSTRLNSG